MAEDFDLGNNTIQTNTKRLVYDFQITRDRTTKEEVGSAICEEIVKDAITGKLITRNQYQLEITGSVLQTCRGHNLFLNDVLSLVNTNITNFNNGTYNSLTGSIRVL